LVDELSHSRPFQIVIAGIGGQGVLFATELLAQAGLAKGFEVIGSETHGMAQRGGSVVSHLKFGPARSPLVRRGTADLLYVFEKTEFFQNASFLAKHGAAVINAPDLSFIGAELLRHLSRLDMRMLTVDASRIAEKEKLLQSANLIMLGFSQAANLLPLGLEDLNNAVTAATPPQFRDANVRALRLGAEQIVDN
jgi:indolepyruvate ferredoxin oxidoreductase beta subunit